VGPAGWTASHALGMTAQVPPTTELAVVGRAPRAPEGIRFHTRANLDRLGLELHEIAVLEVLRDWPLTADCDWDRMRAVLRELEARGLADIKRLQRSVRREPPKVRSLVASLTV
jgi:hypothetical protein